MRIQRKNKQKMFYSLPGEIVEIYERNSDGSIVYTEVDGELVPISHGTKLGYSEPKEFYAVISGGINEVHARQYGIDISSVYSEIVCEKGEVPTVYEMKIWKNSPIKYKTDGTLDVESADYTVKGVLDEFLDFDWLLLQRNIKGGSNG